MINEEWGMMNDDEYEYDEWWIWWMMDDGWWMMKNEWWMMSDEWW